MKEWFAAAKAKATPIIAVTSEALAEGLSDAPAAAAKFAEAQGFKARPGETVLCPGEDGAISTVIFGVGDGGDPYVFGALPRSLPEAVYSLSLPAKLFDPDLAALGWVMGGYAFEKYKSSDRKPARLVPPAKCDVEAVSRYARAIFLVRDLVNTPAGDMGPVALQGVAETFTEAYGAQVRITTGARLIRAGYPLVHAVGRAAEEAPRVIEIEWGKKTAPLIALIGKGITFDTGGLNIKVGNFMRLMKKDMGGAAHALALAQLIMEAKLPCRLHVVVPVAENSIAGNAFRPGDVLTSRAGKTIEIENTDAEGRLVLADAITRAGELDPRLILDFATLTGAARVALGPEIAPYYTNDDKLADALEKAAKDQSDPIWRMPLWDGYERMLDSSIADMRNAGVDAFAGSISAALFLRRFINSTPWVHFDVFAWNATARPGRPAGGDAHGLRAAFGMIESVLKD